MDYLLYRDREETDGYLLGEVNRGKLVLPGNVRHLRITSTSTDSGRVLQDCKVVCHSLLQQQTCPWTLLSPQMPHQTQCQVRRYTPKPLCYQTVLYRYLQIHPRIRPHGLIPRVGTANPYSATQQCMWHSCKTCNHNSNSPRYHSRQFQLLPKEDVALIIWGSKVTGDISLPSDSIPAKR